MCGSLSVCVLCVVCVERERERELCMQQYKLDSHSASSPQRTHTSPYIVQVPSAERPKSLGQEGEIRYVMQTSSTAGTKCSKPLIHSSRVASLTSLVVGRPAVRDSNGVGVRPGFELE